MNNPYFAYSIKSEYSGETSSSNEGSPQVHRSATTTPDTTKKKRTTSRACDVCSIRKTKCDNSRPCRSCVANNIKCTELRVRKKSGPKSLRKKTIDSIKSVGTEFVTISSDCNLVAQLDAGNTFPVLRPLVQLLSSLSPDFFQEAVPFTLPAIATEALSLIACLEQRPHLMGGSVPTNVMRYAVTTLCLILLELLSFIDKPPNYFALLRDLQVHILSIRAACDRLLLFDSGKEKLDFDTHYYLALAELHSFSYLALRAAPNSYKLVHLRTAFSHYELLEPDTETRRYQKAELRRTLQVWERHSYLFGPDRVFRQRDPLMPFVFDNCVDSVTNSAFLNAYYESLRVTNFILESEQKLPEPFTWRYVPGPSDSDFTYGALKSNLDTITESVQLLGSNSDHVASQGLCLIIQFKLLLANSAKLSREHVSEELMEIVVRVNSILSDTGPLVKLFMEKHNMTTVFLEVLAAYLQVTHEEDYTPETLSDLIQFTRILSTHMNERHKPWLEEEPQIRGWFARFTSR